jgi:hypothetical protein
MAEEVTLMSCLQYMFNRLLLNSVAVPTHSPSHLLTHLLIYSLTYVGTAYDMLTYTSGDNKRGFCYNNKGSDQALPTYLDYRYSLTYSPTHLLTHLLVKHMQKTTITTINGSMNYLMTVCNMTVGGKLLITTT